MSIRYYCSGFDKEKGFPEELVDYLRTDIKDLDKLVFIPSDFANKEKIERNSTGLIGTFGKSNFVFRNIVILNENMTKEEMDNHIRTANVVFLMGGNPSIQLDIIESNSLEDAIRFTDSVIMGMSAGAMCMSSYSMLLPVSEKYPNMDIKKGMNLSGISIYPHYNSNGEVPEVLTVDDEKTKKTDLLYANQNYGPIYLLSDNSEIREQNCELTFIGKNIIYLSNGNFELMGINMEQKNINNVK
jgi:peptidase E